MKSSEMMFRMFRMSLVPVFLFVFSVSLNGQEKAQQQKKDDYHPVTRKQVKYDAPGPNESLMKVSEAKVEFIRSVVQSYVDFKDDITNQAVINMIYDQIEKEFVIQPKGKADNRTVRELADLAMEEIRKEYPKDEKEYKKELQEKAEKMYVSYKEGTTIVLTYMRGNRRYKIRDVFYKFNGNTVSIGLKTISFYDLPEEDKIHVSQAYAQKKRDDYVNRELTLYLNKRRDALLSEVLKLERQQLKSNIEAGFVKYADMWRYPIQVINIRLILSIESNPAYSGKVKGLNLDSIQRIQIKYSQDTINKKELENRIMMIKEDAAHRSGTIDSEQGFFNSVFWGFNRKEVKMILESQGFNFIPGEEYDTAYVSDRQISDNKLYYQNDRLVKVVTTYEIDKFSAFLLIKKNLYQKYGPDDATKQKKFVRPGDSVTWSGIVTDGTLHVKQDPATGAIVDKVTLTLEMVPLEERERRAVKQKKGF